MEALVAALLGLVDAEGVADYLPGRALSSFDGTEGGLSTWAGGAVAAVWVVLVGAARCVADLPPGHRLTYAGPPWPRPSERERSSSSASTRSRTAAAVSAPRRIRRVRARWACPATTVRARVTKVKRGFAEGVVTELVSPATSESRRRVGTSARAAAAGSRISPTTPSSREKERQVRDALVRIGRFADPPLEPIVPAASQFRLPQQARVLVHGRR